MSKALRILAVTIIVLVTLPVLATDYVVDQIEPVFQLTIADRILAGRMLVDLEMQPINGNTDLRYSGTFAPVNGLAHHVLRLDLPSWETWVTDMGALTGRWLDFEVELLNGELVRSGIFLEDNTAEDYSFFFDSGSDEGVFVANLDTNREAGRQIIDFESYEDTFGNTRFGGLWVDGTTQPRTHLYFGLSFDELNDLLDPLKGRVVDLERYSDDQDRVRYAVILAMYPGGTSHVTHDMNGTTLFNADAGRSDNLIDLDTYEVSPGGLLFNGVWGDDWKSLREVDPYPPVNFVSNGAEIDNVVTTFENVASRQIGLFAMSLRNGEAVGYKFDEPFYLASVSKLAIHARLWQLHEAGDLNLTTHDLQYGTSGAPGAVPWFVDERGDPGLSTGPCATPDLDLWIPLEDLDVAMMQASDNAATSMLVDDPTYGVSSGPFSMELNEWLAGLSGIGRGWGMVTAIQDVERMLLWQGQQLTGNIDDPSYFSAPAAALETLARNSYRQCQHPVTRLWGSRCGGCLSTTCSGTDEVCVVRWDRWGDLTPHLQTLVPGWPDNSYPNCSPGNPPMVSPSCTFSWSRYYGMGLNAATPRAFGMLQEQLATGQLLNPDNTTAALDVMTEFNSMTGGVPGHVVPASKAGSKGGAERPCTYTSIFRIGPDHVVVAAFTKDNPSSGDGSNCGGVNTFMGNPLGGSGSLGRIVLRRLTADLKATDPELVGFSPTTVHQGQDFSVALDVANTGQIDAPGFDVTFYAVTDGEIGDEDDLEIGTVAVTGVPAGGVAQVRAAVPFPYILPAQYQFAYIIDPPDSVNLPVGEVGEFTEGNDNLGLLSDAVLTVLPAGPPCEDLDLDGYHDCFSGCDSSGLVCGDCNDGTNLISPLAVDTCNQLDDDCDGIPDPGAARPATQRVVEDPDPEISEELGTSVARLGDLNGDGVDEYAVGQPDAHSPVASYAGMVRVYSGLDGSLYCEVYDPAGGGFDDFGTSIAGLPDVTGDPVPDFIVGSPRHGAAAYNAGAALVFGGATCLMHRRILPVTAEQGEAFGTTVAAVGDVNLDGEEDVAIGAPERDGPGGGSTGAIVIYSVNDTPPLLTLTDPAAAGGDRLGTAILGPGDMNGDLVPDILGGVPNQGEVVVFSGSSGAIVDTWARNVSYYRFGFSLASLGDVTGDTIPDIVVGTTNADTLAGPSAGDAQLLSGADGTALFTMADLSGGSGDDFGYSVAAAGDVDGDGVQDIAVGQPLHDGSAGIDVGGVVIFSGATGVPLYDLVDPAGRADDRLGWSLAQLGDLTGDGLPELAAGAPLADAIEAADAGRVLVWSMEADCDADGVTPFDGDCDDQLAVTYPGAPELCDALDNDCDMAIDEDNDGDSYDVCDPDECDDTDAAIHAGAPERCNGLDDNCDSNVDEGVDGDLDGYSDVCDCDDGNGAINPGAIDDVCDRVDMDCNNVTDDGFASPVGERAMELDPGFPGAQLGTSVAVIGDLNGDGLAEIAVGVPVENTGNQAAGAVAVFDGATGGLHCMMLSTDPGSFDDLGRSIAVLDDATGDGIPDLLAGAPRDDDPQPEAGTLAVFSGADCSMAYKTFDPASGFQILLGQVVGAIGDVTGDGLTDYAAAAPAGDDVGVTNAGYVVAFDGETGDVLYRVYNINPTAFEQFGTAIAGGHDLDADGVPDFVVGSQFDDTSAGSQAGSVLVVSGATGTPIRKLIDIDGFLGDHLGFSVALIEDLDGDAVADILAGSPNNDAGGTNAGAVLAYSGATGSFIGRAAFNEPGALPVMGRSLAVMPDIDGDGVADIAAGAPQDDEGATDTGSVYLISGADLSLIRRLSRPLGQAGEEIGTSVAVAPDLTGDGMPEVIAGAPLHDGVAGNSSGLAVVFAIEADCDGDGVSPFGGDCDDGNGDAYGRPGDVESLVFDDKDNTSWQPPSDPGGTILGLAYDVLQSGDAADFSTAATCAESEDTDTTAFVPDTPGPGTALYFVVRARNACDVGPAGHDSAAIERPARACP